MKILALGDFHGKFPQKLKKVAKEADLILCTGDFADAEKIRKIIFKNWLIEKPWYEVIGVKKAKKLEKQSFDSGLKILREINSLNKKAYTIWGNTDFYKTTLSKKELNPGFYENKIKKLKNIKIIDRKKLKINNLEIIGHGKYLDITEYIKTPQYDDKKKQKKLIKRYKKSEHQLKKLFQKTKPKKGFVFLIHYPPYGIFDKVKFKHSPMNNKHVGFQPYNKIIKKYQPSLVICGHMHEHHSFKKVYNSIIISHGDASKGKAALIEINKKNKIKNIKLIK